jgi:hypothetical protein
MDEGRKLEGWEIDLWLYYWDCVCKRRKAEALDQMISWTHADLRMF